MHHEDVGDQVVKLGLRMRDVVRMRRVVERGSFTVAAGAQGTIVALDSDLLSVEITEPVPGAEPWDNEVIWTREDIDAIAGDIEFVSRPPEPERSYPCNYCSDTGTAVDGYGNAFRCDHCRPE